ncbi:hypothetical protein IJG96_02320, partial [Candidatus Saccharibacteria bacterium]|nr:hypothetical protein [Candidatus Saccharibacteria bacterium]
DTGIGIAAEDLQHVFQKFYRADNSQTRTVGGTGLGLYLVKQRVEAMAGRVWAESAFGEGSTFYVSLPRLTSDEFEKRQIAEQNKRAVQAFTEQDMTKNAEQTTVGAPTVAAPSFDPSILAGGASVATAAPAAQTVQAAPVAPTNPMPTTAPMAPTMSVPPMVVPNSMMQQVQAPVYQQPTMPTVGAAPTLQPMQQPMAPAAQPVQAIQQPVVQQPITQMSAATPQSPVGQMPPAPPMQNVQNIIQ